MLDITIQLLRALNYIHEKKIVHRDFKPDNVLCTKADSTGQYTVKLTDFGFATKIERTYETRNIGTSVYKAPDVWQEKYGRKSDVWSLGVTLYELQTGRLPFEPRSDLNTIQGK
jgi:serine/threonine protein kinase